MYSPAENNNTIKNSDFVSSINTTIENVRKKWNKQMDPIGCQPIDWQNCKKCTWNWNKPINIWSILGSSSWFCQRCLICNTEFNVPRTDVVHWLLYSNNFCHVAATVAAAPAPAVATVVSFAYFHCFIECVYVCVHASQLQIAWNSNFNRLRLSTFFIVIGCAFIKIDRQRQIAKCDVYIMKWIFTVWIITYTQSHIS